MQRLVCILVLLFTGSVAHGMIKAAPKNLDSHTIEALTIDSPLIAIVRVVDFDEGWRLRGTFEVLEILKAPSGYVDRGLIRGDLNREDLPYGTAFSGRVLIF